MLKVFADISGVGQLLTANMVEQVNRCFPKRAPLQLALNKFGRSAPEQEPSLDRKVWGGVE